MKRRITMTTKVVLALSVLCLSKTNSFSQDTARTASQVGKDRHEVLVEIPEVFELANVAIAISDIGLEHPNRVHKHGAYYQRVLKHSLPFKAHRLIQEPDLHRNNTYFLRDNSICFVFKLDPGRKFGRFMEFSEELLRIYRHRAPGQSIPFH